MAILTSLPNTINATPTDSDTVATIVASATSQLVDGIVQAATLRPSPFIADTLVASAVSVIDTAGVIANDALNLTRAASPTDAKAQQVADCARAWSVVAAIVAAVVTIIIAIVVQVFSFGAATGGTLANVAVAAVSAATAVCAAVCAIISVICTIITSLPALIQVNVIAVLQAMPQLFSASTDADRTRQGGALIDKLRQTIVMIQSAEAQHLPSVSVDLTKSLAAADQVSAALQRLLAALRQTQPIGQMALVVTELGQLAQAHSAIATQLRLTKPPATVPGVVSPVSRTATATRL